MVGKSSLEIGGGPGHASTSTKTHESGPICVRMLHPDIVNRISGSETKLCPTFC